ncbi:MAG: 3-hydroxyacyl-CoA dehydrogenase NAD-binding domain-containing protein [Planctomycetota bacterium]
MSSLKIERAAVLGSGVMGTALAAHLANAGLDVLLLDIVPPELSPEDEAKGLTKAHPAFRNRFAAQSLERALKSDPAPFFTKSLARRIHVGNLEDDLSKIAEVDWILEAVIERLDIKQSLFEKVEAHRKPGTIVTTNTSGLSVAAMAEGRSDDFRAHFLGTHFFNPPRYLHLLEIIPGPDTKAEVVDFMSRFGDRRLGKGVVPAKDTPNFIANRIGAFAALHTIHAMIEAGLSVEAVDKLTGKTIGRPKSATFRTADLVGLDTFLHVARNIVENAPGDESRSVFEPPAAIQQMVEKKWLGEKTGQGFYKKSKDEEGNRMILSLDLKTMEYGPQEKVALPVLEMSKNVSDLRERLQMLIADRSPAGQFLWQTLSATLVYAAHRVPEISDSIQDVDAAMRWGFGWELGPFEIWDAFGVDRVVKRLEKEGRDVPPLALMALGHGGSFYLEDGPQTAVLTPTGERVPFTLPEGVIVLDQLKKQEREIKRNAGASLIDLGDGIACFEFHSKMNSIGADTLGLLSWSLDEVTKNFEGLVIGNQGSVFSAGANLMLLLLEAQEGNWDEIDLAIRQFQKATTSLRRCIKPVVVAPFQLTLGGGCEFVLHGDRVQASAEAYVGLVELGVGLIPAAGGTKEMAARALCDLPPQADPLPPLMKAFETIAMAKVAKSAREAFDLGFLRQGDGITMNGDRLIAAAKARALAMAEAGYAPPPPPEILAVGRDGLAALRTGVRQMLLGNYISEYDAHLAEKVAHILCGGELTRPTLCSEQYFLDLEREAFLSLVGHRNTQARMGHMLKTGKPLRN